MRRPLPALAVAALALLPALPALRGDALLVGRDLLAYGHARGAALGQALREEGVPRWNPHAHHGASWWGPRAGGVVYPANALLALLPPGVAVAWFVALHLALAIEGARRLARHDLPAAPAAAAGLAYGLSGFVLSTHWNLPFLASAALLPWAGVAGRVAAARPARGAALAGATAALCLLAAEPQGALVAAGLACALAARDGGGRAAAACAAGVALGALAAGPQMLSILHELPDTDRALGPADARFGLAARALALGLVAPGALGEHAAAEAGYWGHELWDGTLPYCALGVGALGLAAAVTAAVRRGPLARAGLALVAAGVVLAALDPGAALGLRFPAKWLVLSGLGLALLVGAGARALARGDAAPARVTLALLLAVALPLALALAAPARDLEAWLAARQPGEVLGEAARAATAAALARLAAAAALGLLALGAARRLSPRPAAALLLGALALDLGLTALPAVRTSPLPLLEAPPLVAALDPRPGAPPPRYFSRGRLRAPLAPTGPDGVTPGERDEALARDVLEGSRALPHGVRAIDAFETVHAAAFDRLARDPRLAALPAPERWGRLDAAWLPAGPAEVTRAGGAFAPRGEVLPGLLLVENLACPPWAYLVAAAAPARDLEAAIEATCAGRRRPEHLVVLGPEGLEVAERTSPPGPGGEVLGVDVAPERLVVRVRAAGPAWLVVREAYSRDWAATLDGAPVETARADVLFRAVAVPPGEHEVVMLHAPAWWAPGLALAALGWAGLAALGVRGCLGPRRGA